MPTQTNPNPLVARFRTDNVFGAGLPEAQFRQEHPFAPTGWMSAGPSPSIGEQNAMNNSGIYAPGSFGAANALANGTGGSVPAAQFVPQQSPISLATGNIFGVGTPVAERNAAVGATVPQQVAGVVAGLPDQNRVNIFQQRLMDAGINPGNMAANSRTVQAIYNNVFGAGLPAGAPSSASGLPNGVPVSTFAPTGLRQQAIAAGGNEIVGDGGALVSARPNAQGGTAFSLRQNPFAVAAQRSPAPQAAPAAAVKTPFEQNAAAFRDHMVAQQMQAGLMKSLPQGYMLDPDRPGAIKAIPGGPAEQKINEERKAQEEKVRQVNESTANVIGTIDKVIPEIDNLTAGPMGTITSKLPGTKGYDVSKLLSNVKSNLGVSQLQQMREASKNGASGFGQLSEKELDVLTSTIANLDQAQSPQQLIEGLNKVRDHYNAWKASYDAGQKAASGALSPQDQAKAILAIRAASKGK